MAMLEAREKNGREITGIDCDTKEHHMGDRWDKWERVKWDDGYIDDGIKHLYGVDGKPKNGKGPNNCGRVSCSWSAAIFWCNDVSFSFSGSFRFFCLVSFCFFFSFLVLFLSLSPYSPRY